MKKDYVVETDASQSLQETEFVEEFWTKRWEERSALPLPLNVSECEEFKLMKPFLAQLPPQSRILDAGCGMGEWTVYLTDQNFQVYGLDISKNTIERLQKVLPSYTFVCGDIRQTDFTADYFDACFAWGVYEHFEKGLGECLLESRRILKPGGWLFISVPFQNWRHILRDAMPLQKSDNLYSRQNGYSVPQRFYQWRLTMPELERELAIHGFSVKLVKPIHKIEGVNRFLEWDLPFLKNSNIGKKILYKIIPASWVGHMVFIAGQKKS